MNPPFRSARNFHQDVRAFEQRVVGQADDNRVGQFTFVRVRSHRDRRPGELLQSCAEVEICPGVVGAPAPLLAPVALEHGAAEIEASLEGLIGCKARRSVTVPTRPDPLGRANGDGQRDHDG
jgi:hypothetical protein